jgi:hypothetical protein
MGNRPDIIKNKKKFRMIGVATPAQRNAMQREAVRMDG